MRDIGEIIIHCSDTYPEMDIGVDKIRQWHLDRGWDDIGYHFVIRRSGEVEAGRPIDIPGAHARGHNKHSIGICLVGGKAHEGEQPCNFTVGQWEALAHLVKAYKASYPAAPVIGHNQVSDKTCPTFNVSAWWEGMQ